MYVCMCACALFVHMCALNYVFGLRSAVFQFMLIGDEVSYECDPWDVISSVTLPDPLLITATDARGTGIQ